MDLSPEETQKLKDMFMYLIKKRNKMSKNHNGFHLIELRPILDELEKEGKIERRPTINKQMYFLKK